MRGCDLDWRYFWTYAIGALLVAIVGCGGTNRLKTIPISGSVTIDGKAPGESGKIYFTPTAAAAGYSRRPASGSYTRDGNYLIMSWAPDDGLVPGHYTVALTPNEPDKSAIPSKYNMSGTSGFEVDVPVDQSKIEFSIDVKTK
jgi:hypothetical protein